MEIITGPDLPNWVVEISACRIFIGRKSLKITNYFQYKTWILLYYRGLKYVLVIKKKNSLGYW